MEDHASVAVVGDHTGHGHSYMGLVVVGSRGDMGHHMGDVVGSHPLGHGVVGSVHSGGRRSSHGVVGYVRGIHVKSSLLVGHGGRSRQLGMVVHGGHGLGRGSGHGHHHGENHLAYRAESGNCLVLVWWHEV